MKLLVRISFLGLMIIALLLTACGEEGFDIEKPLSKIFIMDDGSGGDTTKTSLNNETIERLDLDLDDENKVRQSLDALLDKDIKIETEEGRKNILSALQYAFTMLQRSELLPKEDRSKCNCDYQFSTFQKAVDVMGQYAVQMHQQTISTRKEEEPKIYDALYKAFTQTQKYLTHISTVNITGMIQVQSDKDTLTEIQKSAKTYLEKLSQKATDTDTKTETD